MKADSVQTGKVFLTVSESWLRLRLRALHFISRQISTNILSLQSTLCINSCTLNLNEVKKNPHQRSETSFQMSLSVTFFSCNGQNCCTLCARCGFQSLSFCPTDGTWQHPLFFAGLLTDWTEVIYWRKCFVCCAVLQVCSPLSLLTVQWTCRNLQLFFKCHSTAELLVDGCT